MTVRKTALFALFALLLLAGCDGRTSGLDTVTGLENHTGSVQAIIDLVHAGKPNEALALLDSLHAAVVSLRADLRGLRFTGTANTLLDPFILPAGTYRVHLTTAGHAFVDVYDMQGKDLKSLFIVGTGEASAGQSTFFVSTGQQILVEISYVSAPFTLEFEKL